MFKVGDKVKLKTKNLLHPESYGKVRTIKSETEKPSKHCFILDDGTLAYADDLEKVVKQ